MKNILPLLCLFFLLASCEKEPSPIQVPTSYNFERNGVSTVDFSGQTTRLLMAEELINAMLDFEKSEEELSDMFSNTNNPFTVEALNTSDKSIKSKVAASKDYFSTNTAASAQIKQRFEEWMKAQVDEVYPAVDQLASPGIAGQIADGAATRYVNAKGLEYNQAVGKTLIGALMTDQMLNNYLSTSVLDEGNNRADNDMEVVTDGKPYTTMEHKWDEAYGYIFGTSQDIANPLATLGADDSFLNKYLAKVNADPDFEGIDKAIFDAFKLGRAAIVAGDYEVRDQQANIIRAEISTIIGARTVYYLQQGKKAIQEGNMGSAFHDLSEAYGFLYSLEFTREANTNSPHFSAEDRNDFIEKLIGGNGFWDVEPRDLDEISQAIADRFDFSLEEAAE